MRFMRLMDPPSSCRTVVPVSQQVKELEGRLNQNSSNSGKPPSSDGYKKPNPKSLRGKSGKLSGGQFGHKAHQLPLNENPDHVITYPLDICEKCHFDLKSTYPGRKKHASP